MEATLAMGRTGMTGRMLRGFLGATLLLTMAAGPASAASGDRVWAKRYAGPGFAAAGNAVAVSPDGSRVFMTSKVSLDQTNESSDIVTIAYEAGTGVPLWKARYDGPATGINDWDAPTAVTTDPSGALVFVTGFSTRIQYDQELLTIAYDAATGDEVWIRRFTPLAQTTPIGIVTNERRVFIAGNGYDVDTGAIHPITVAYGMAAGHEAWSRIGSSDGSAADIAASPSGRQIFVTGITGLFDDADIQTQALRAGTGERMWRARWNGPDDLMDVGRAVAVSGDGSTVFVTGTSFVPPSDQGKGDIVVIAYGATTGQRMWKARYDGPGTSYDTAIGVVADAGGGGVYVTGQSRDETTIVHSCCYPDQYVTIRYDQTTGHQDWASRYEWAGEFIDVPRAIAIAADDGTVYVTGMSRADPSSTEAEDLLTVAYHADTGALAWDARYDTGLDTYDEGLAIATDATGARVFVSGSAGQMAVTVAYEA